MKKMLKVFAAIAVFAALYSCTSSKEELEIPDDNGSENNGGQTLGGKPEKLLIRSVHYWNADGRDNIRTKADYDLKFYDYDEQGRLDGYTFFEVISDKAGRQWQTASNHSQYDRLQAGKLTVSTLENYSSYCSYSVHSEVSTPEGGNSSTWKDLREIDVKEELDKGFTNEWNFSNLTDSYKLNEAGFLVEDLHSYGYRFDDSGHFVWHEAGQGYIWNDGNMIALTASYGGDAIADISYTDYLNKPCGIDLVYYLLTNEDDSVSYPLSSAGFFGTPCKNLMSKMLPAVDMGAEVKYEWSWTLDADGYPSSVHVKADVLDGGLRHIEELIEFEFVSFEDYRKGNLQDSYLIPAELPSR